MGRGNIIPALNVRNSENPVSPCVSLCQAAWPPSWMTATASSPPACRHDDRPPDNEPEPPPDPSPPALGMPWRDELPRWSIPRRQRWGDLANQLAESGVPWPDDERQAFET